MTTVLQKLVQGAGAGTLATIPMTAVMIGAERLGLLGTPPPAKITDAVLDKAEVATPPAERRLWTAVAHFGFGAATGALYAVLRPGRRSPAQAALEGIAFGTAVWGASYAGWIPALGILPSPIRDRKDRQLSMIVAHWVFGAGVALLVLAARKRW